MKSGTMLQRNISKEDKNFYINGIFLSNEDFENVTKLAKKEYETAKVVFKNKDQVQKNFKPWTKKPYTNNRDFKESKTK